VSLNTYFGRNSRRFHHLKQIALKSHLKILLMKKPFIVFDFLIVCTMLLSFSISKLQQSDRSYAASNQPTHTLKSKSRNIPMTAMTTDKQITADNMKIGIVPHGAVFRVGEYSIGTSVASKVNPYSLPDKTQVQDQVAAFSTWRSERSDGEPADQNLILGAGGLIKVGNYNILIVHVEPREKDAPQWTNNRGWVAYKILPS
jgi:hypothetical protein